MTDVRKEKREVRMGLCRLVKPMTFRQAKRFGEQCMPADLKQAGFKTTVFVSDPEINGGLFFRINYGKTVPANRCSG